MTDEEMAEGYIAENGFGSDCNNLTSFDANKEIEKAYLAGLKAGRPKWHKVADGDLPTHSYRVLVFTDEGVGFGIYGLDDKKWHTYDTGFDVIAWKEIVFPKESE